jgi:hypothetical protein
MVQVFLYFFQYQVKKINFQVTPPPPFLEVEFRMKTFQPGKIPKLLLSGSVFVSADEAGGQCIASLLCALIPFKSGKFMYSYEPR